MISIPIKVSEGIAPPAGNPFQLRTVGDVYVSQGEVREIYTGLGFALPVGMMLRIRSTSPNLYVVDWQIDEGELKVAVVAVGANVQLVGKVIWAQAEIVPMEKARIRFLETAEGGGRVIKGDAQPVKSGE